MSALLWAGVFRSSVAIAAYRQEGRLLFINDAMIHLLGYPLEVLSERGWLATIAPDPEEQVRTRQVIEQLTRPGAPPLHHKRNLTCADGTQRLLHMISTPVALAGGELGVATLAFDVTRFHSPLGNGSLEDGGATANTAPEALARFDAHSGKLLFVTPSVEQLFGYLPEELYADPRQLRWAIQPEFKTAYKEAFRRCLAGEAQWTVLGVRRKDGNPIMLHLAFYPLRDASARVVVVEAMARDVTAVYALRKRLEQTIAELRERNDELASLDRLKSQLLANVSHELRTPLVSIKGYNDLLRRGALGPLTERQRRGLEIAGANTDRLIELIETLLDYAQSEGGRMVLQRSRIDVRLPIRDALSQMSDRIRTRGIELTVELGDDAFEVEGDHGRLVQVWRALLSNAEKFCDGKGLIRVKAQRVGDEVCVAVDDTGVGIPEAARAKVFDPFYQVDASPTRRFGGAGLGLALAREIVTLHGGRIVVDSVEGKGSSFQVVLPLAPSCEGSQATEQPLLVIGSSAVRASELRQLLEGEGFTLLEAQGVAELVRRARRHRPDALVLAFEREELEEALHALRGEAETHGLPIVAVVQAEHRADALCYADYVLTAEELARLPSRLRRLLGHRDERDPRRRPRVVIVDDEPSFLDFIRFLLDREGYEVRCATSSEWALEHIDGSCDLAILDVVIDGHDGIELCRRLKSAPATREVPIIVITGRPDGDVRHNSFVAGADGFLLKPFSVDDFLRQVRLHLRDAAPRKMLDSRPGRE